MQSVFDRSINPRQATQNLKYQKVQDRKDPNFKIRAQPQYQVKQQPKPVLKDENEVVEHIESIDVATEQTKQDEAKTQDQVFVSFTS